MQHPTPVARNLSMEVEFLGKYFTWNTFSAWLVSRESEHPRLRTEEEESSWTILELLKRRKCTSEIYQWK